MLHRIFSVLLIFLVFGCATTRTEEHAIQCIKGSLGVFAQHTVEASGSYSGASGPVWVWETVFENSGTIGVTITHKEVKIQAPDGSVWWETVDRVTKEPVGKVRIDIRIKPGSSNSYKYWCYDTSHTICNGVCSLIFYATDDKGNSLVLPTMVLLSHKECPKRVK